MDNQNHGRKKQSRAGNTESEEVSLAEERNSCMNMSYDARH